MRWQAFIATAGPERSGVGLNELLGRKVAEVETTGRVSARDSVWGMWPDWRERQGALRECRENQLGEREIAKPNCRNTPRAHREEQDGRKWPERMKGWRARTRD